MYLIKLLIRIGLDLFFFPFLLLGSLVARFCHRKIQIGIGPEPIISHLHLKKALIHSGFSVETFVNQVYYITSEFDYRGDKIFNNKQINYVLLPYILFLRSIFRYQLQYFYFRGGSLGDTILLWRAEPYLLWLAKVKVVLTAYGADIQNMYHTGNLIFRSTISKTYPKNNFNKNRIQAKIDLWTTSGSYILAGCDWVEYLFHWDRLCLGPFVFDFDIINRPEFLPKAKITKSFRIVAAPNHGEIKGIPFLKKAITELNQEGFDIDLLLVEKKSNIEVLEAIASADLIFDQIIIGFYAFFAIEAMALGKPVMCHIKPALEELYIHEGLIEPDELPFIRVDFLSLKERIAFYYINREALEKIGVKSKKFVHKFHSAQYISNLFEEIFKKHGIFPLMN